MRKDTHFVNIVIHRFRQILVFVSFTFALTAHLEYVHISFLYTMQPDVMDNTADTHTNRLEDVEPVFFQHKDVVKQSGTDNKANELRPYSQGKLEKKLKLIPYQNIFVPRSWMRSGLATHPLDIHRRIFRRVKSKMADYLTEIT